MVVPGPRTDFDLNRRRGKQTKHESGVHKKKCAHGSQFYLTAKFTDETTRNVDFFAVIYP